MGSRHNNHSSTELYGRNLVLSIILNIVITVSQAIGGLISGSLSLLSDALHNFSDVISLLISYIANLLAKKEASTNKTFGYKRAEIIGGLYQCRYLINSFCVSY